MENGFNNLIDKCLKELNYIKKKGTWVYDNGTCYILCEIQKSRNANGYFLNFGIYFKYFLNGAIIPLKSYEWHLIGRHNQILKETHSLIEESEINDKLYSDELINKIKYKVHPFLKEVSDVRFLKEYFPDKFPHEKLWLQNIDS